ncbi:MAG: 3-deoxy-7-phosphoheptulonate synthase [Bacillota bacterium]
MIVVMDHQATGEQIEAVTSRLSKAGFQVHLSQGVARTVIGVIGDHAEARLAGMAIEAMVGVEKVLQVQHPFKLAGREFKPDNTLIRVKGIEIGGEAVHVAAGPCAVESREQLQECAHRVKKAGATLLRGGAFKPRTSPYTFQGLEERALRLLAEVGEETGLPVVSEIMDTHTLEMARDYVDIFQVGARNMQNFRLLRELGKADKPVLLKRGPSATIEEWILAAEYILSAGNYNVILCERGIRTFETYTRNTLDLNAVPAVKQLSHLPVMVDPSHGTGRWKLVMPMARAALAAGSDGLLIEVHPNPAEALSDGPQSLTPDNFAALMQELGQLAPALGRKLEPSIS